MSSCPNSTAEESDSLPARCDDPSTWRHKGEKIDLPRLLQLIEQNGGPEGLDLHGGDLSHIEAGPETLRPYADAYAQKHGADAQPPWLARYAEGGIDVNGAHLEYARLDHAHLENACLDHAHLQKVSLWRARLENASLVDAHLENARLEDAHLENAQLGGALLENAKLNEAHLENAHLPGAHLEYADLPGAHLENADLPGAHLEYARLWDAHLENACLWNAHLENANLVDAHLENADLDDAHLENAVLEFAHLEDARLVGTRLHAAFWYEAYLDRTRMRRESLGHAIGDELGAKGRAARSFSFHHAREAYLTLKTNFDSIGRYDDASWAYVKEQQMEKAMYFPTSAGHRWIRQRIGGAVPPPWWGPRHLPGWLWWKLRSAVHHIRLFLGLCPREVRQEMTRRDEQGEERDEWLSRWHWARNWAYELLTGYGERVHMPVIWAGVAIAVFTGVYTGAGNVAAGGGGDTHNVLTAFTHSIATFATVGFNTLEPQGWGARLLTAIEAMCGIGLFALFVFTLGNRMRRS